MILGAILLLLPLVVTGYDLFHKGRPLPGPLLRRVFSIPKLRDYALLFGEDIDPFEKQSSLFKSTEPNRRSEEVSGAVSLNSLNRVRSTKKATSMLFKMSTSFMFLLTFSKKAVATAISSTLTPESKSRITPIQGLIIWVSLFLLSACLHGAESAMTKISPWRVKEVADEEGKGSPFVTLSEDLTKLLSTILLTTTACSIYGTALFVSTIQGFFPKLTLGYISGLLTIVTLFFGEILPKAIAVSNSELIVRNTVRPLAKLASLLNPITITFTTLSSLFLKKLKLNLTDDNKVSEDMLRMVVDEAAKSSSTDGIENKEGRMIKAVLDMEETPVAKIMRPRIDIEAIAEDATLTELLETSIATKYSRIPVFREDIDNIIGVVFSKDLLDFILLGFDSISNLSLGKENALENVEGSENVQILQQNENMEKDLTENITKKKALSLESIRNLLSIDFEGTLPENELTPTGLSFATTKLNETDSIRSTYFIPETMTTWNALQEMRKRRVHMAIVVDEYGGTAGLVTFEDILEEVVGEIYDEGDDEDDIEEGTIFLREGGVFEIKGYAELDDVYEALSLHRNIDEEEFKDTSGDISTIGGLLCSQAGQIPVAGYTIEFGGYLFSVEEVDDRRILLLRAVRWNPMGTAIPENIPIDQDVPIIETTNDGEFSENKEDSMAVEMVDSETEISDTERDIPVDIFKQNIPVNMKREQDDHEKHLDELLKKTEVESENMVTEISGKEKEEISMDSDDVNLQEKENEGMIENREDENVLTFRDGEWINLEDNASNGSSADESD